MAKKKVVALFNYGGGMRGLIPSHIMSIIEQRTGLRMAEMVDVFAGPSTGAILNAALNTPHPSAPDRPKYRAKHLVKFYEREGIHIFPNDDYRAFRGFVHDFNNRTMKFNQLNNLFRHGHYDTTHLHRSLRALYGHTRLSESLNTLIIPTYNIDGEQLRIAKEDDESVHAPAHTVNNLVDEGGQALWLKNMRIEGARNVRSTIDVDLFDAVVASTAAPSYFPCHHFSGTDMDTGTSRNYSGIDGCIFDNPCISYMGALRHHLPKDTELHMIILGTGHIHRSFSKEDWNKYGAMGIIDPVNDLPLINILFHASETALLEAFAAEMGGHLYHFNKSLVNRKSDHYPSAQIDDASPENLTKLRNFAFEIMEDQEAMLDDVCHMLTGNHEARQKSSGKTQKSLIGRLFDR